MKDKLTFSPQSFSIATKGLFRPRGDSCHVALGLSDPNSFVAWRPVLPIQTFLVQTEKDRKISLNFRMGITFTIQKKKRQRTCAISESFLLKNENNSYMRHFLLLGVSNGISLP